MSNDKTMTFENNIPKGLSKLAGLFHNEAKRELRQIGDELLKVSGDLVPHDEGTLQDSGVVKQPSDLVVEVGYHTPYAARLHEHPEYRFQKGRQGKYLETPLKENSKAWLQVMANKLKSLQH